MFLPPIYHLVACFTKKGSKEHLIESSHPIQIVPKGLNHCELVLYGTGYNSLSSYVWDKIHPNSTDRITKIIYNIIVTSALSDGDTARKVTAFSARFSHEFKHSVKFDDSGIRAATGNGLLEYQFAVDGLPKLPRDWQYMQFVG